MVDVKRSGPFFRIEGVIRSQQICVKVLVYFMKVTLLATPILEWKLSLPHVKTLIG